jgi:hypothetical protein
LRAQRPPGGRVAAFCALLLGAPLLAAAPRPHNATPPPAPPVLSDVYGIRALSRADTVGQASAPPATAAPAATATLTPGPARSPAVVSAARAEFEAWQSGKIDASRYSAYARTQFTDATVAQVSQGLQTLGPIKTFTFVRQLTIQGMKVDVFRAACANGSFDELIAWDSAGKIPFIYFRQPT